MRTMRSSRSAPTRASCLGSSSSPRKTSPASGRTRSGGGSRAMRSQGSSLPCRSATPHTARTWCSCRTTESPRPAATCSKTGESRHRSPTPRSARRSRCAIPLSGRGRGSPRWHGPRRGATTAASSATANTTTMRGKARSSHWTQSSRARRYSRSTSTSTRTSCSRIVVKSRSASRPVGTWVKSRSGRNRIPSAFGVEPELVYDYNSGYFTIFYYDVEVDGLVAVDGSWL